MEKLISLFLTLMLLGGCSTVSPKIDIVQEKIPIPYVPKPPSPIKPELVMKTLTPEERKDIGKLSKALGVDIIQMVQYIDILEAIINKYKELSLKNPSILEKNSDEWKEINNVEKYFEEINKD